MPVRENRRLAQRCGFSRGLVDFGTGRVVPQADLLEELIEAVREDAEEPGSIDGVLDARTILERGTGAQPPHDGRRGHRRPQDEPRSDRWAETIP